MKQQPPIDVPFDERDFTSKQTKQILAVGKTKLFELLRDGALEAYLDGNRLRISGRSIKAYRERRFAEGRQARPVTAEQLSNLKHQKDYGPPDSPSGP